MNWLAYHPDGLSQVLYNETNACATYAPIDSIETQIFFLTGQKIQFSRRWMAIMDGTDKQGNYIGVPPPTYQGLNKGALPSIQKYGLVLESSYPQSPTMTWDEYFTPPTPELQTQLLVEGQAFLEKWAITCSYGLNLATPQIWLNKAPLLARVKEGGIEHFVEVLNETTMFDSEPHTNNPATTFIQPLPPVEAFYQIIINPKNMPQFKTQNYHGELRIVLQADSEQTWEALCKVYSVDPKQIDETIN